MKKVGSLVNDRRVDFLFLFLLGLSALLWTPLTKLFLIGDPGASFLWFPSQNMSIFSAWSSIDGGVPNFLLSRIPWNLFFSSLNLVGFNYIASQKIFFVLTNSVAAISIYYLTYTILENHKHRRLASLIASTFYIFNPFRFIAFGTQWNDFFLVTYAIFPLITAFYIKGLKNLGCVPNMLKYSLAVGLCSILIFMYFPTIAYIIMLSLLLISITFIHVIFNSKTRIKASLFLLLSALVALLLNMYWIFPLMFQLDTAQSWLASVTAQSLGSSLFDNLRLIGHWAFNGSAFGKPYYPYASVFLTNPLFIFTLLIAPFLAFGSLLFSRKKEIMFLSLIAAITLLFSVGTYPPLFDFYGWLVVHVPLFVAFREPTKFLLVVTMIYSILIGFTTSHIYEKLNKKSPVFFRKRKFTTYLGLICTIVIICTFLLNSWPLLTGAVAYSPYADANGQRSSFTLPTGYQELNDYLAKQPGDYRVLMLPPRSEYTYYTWGYTGASTTIDHLISNPNVIGVWSQSEENSTYQVICLIYDAIYNGSTTEVAKLLGLFNIKYIVVETSLDTNFSSTYSIADTISALGQQKGLIYVGTFGDLMLYENEDFQSRIYATSDFWFINSNLIQSLQSVGDFTQSSVILSSDLGLYGKELPNTTQRVFILQKSADTNAIISSQGWTIYTSSEVGITSSVGTYYSQYPNATIQYQITVPENGYYSLYAYVRWDGARATLQASIDNGSWTQEVIPLYGNESDVYPYKYDLISIGDVYLTTGNHTLSFTNTAPYDNLGYQNIRSFLLCLNQTIETPTIQFTKTDINTYSVQVTANQPCLVVLSESYDKNWGASINGVQIPDSYHYLVNGYSNAWYVNQTGSFIITIKYVPQNYLWIGSAISIGAFVCLIIGCFYKSYTKSIRPLFKKLKHKNFNGEDI